MEIDLINGNLGLVDGVQSPSGKVLFIDTSTDSVVSSFSATSGGYKGWIMTDNQGTISTVAKIDDYLRLYDSTNFVSGDTVSLIPDSGGNRSAVYNTLNSNYYILEFGARLQWIDSTLTPQGSVSLISYSGSGINSDIVYNENKNQIYILNVRVNGSYGIITFDCTSNTIVDFVDGLYTGASTGAYGGGIYLDTIQNPDQLLLWTVTNNTVKILSIP
jgi:hypothetical protein